MDEFFKRVYDLVAKIPCGRVASYGQLAHMLGRPNGGRVVGWAMRYCPDGLPWQRVVMSDGSVTGGMYADMRRAMLEAEGVPFLPDGRVDIAACRWDADTANPENSIKIPDANLFMQCDKLNREALSKLPEGYNIRNCRQDELDLWKAMHFDEPEQAAQFKPYMDEFFDRVYAPKESLFFERCKFVCEGDKPVGTCFVWRAYGEVNTLHWFKVLKNYENRGLGRALLSAVLGGLSPQDFPVFLHTQPSSYRAIKLYSDFGFALITDEYVGYRHNDIGMCRPILERIMPAKCFERLKYANADKRLIDTAQKSRDSEF